MIAHLPSIASTLLLVFGPLATLSSAWAPCLLDPVTTYTNGLPLASTDPMRTHNFNYGCDPYRVGCCGGHYLCPCLKGALFPNRCCGCQPAPPDACRNRVGAADNREPSGVITLGNLPAPSVGGVFGAGPASPAAASPFGR